MHLAWKHLPVEADKTPFKRSSHLVRFWVASDCSRLIRVSWTSEISFPSVSVSIIPNKRPSSPVSVTMASSLLSSPARVKAWSLTSPASRVTNCLRQATAARRSRRWELARVACDEILHCHKTCKVSNNFTQCIIYRKHLYYSSNITFWIFKNTSYQR